MINPEFLNTDDKYYSDTTMFTVSKYKKFNKCENDGLYGDNTANTVPILIGSYVDRYVEGTLETWLLEHPELFLKTGNNKGQLKSEYRIAEDICHYIDENKILSQFLSGDKQVVMTGEISGIPWKIKIDSYSPHIAINDLKVVREIRDNKGKYIDFIRPWGYDIQMSVYQEIVRQNTDELLPVFICACSKTNPIDSVIINIPQDVLDNTLNYVKMTAPDYWEVYQGKREPIKCGVCPTCIKSNHETPIISLEDIGEW